MKFNYSKEFDLNLIYKKLTSGRKPAMVKACDFFNRKTELEMLQIKMHQILALQHKKRKTFK